MTERQQLSEWILLMRPQGPGESRSFPQSVRARDISITGDASDFDVVLPLMTGPHGKTCERL